MIETDDGRLLSLSEFKDGRWTSGEQEESDCARIAAAVNTVTELEAVARRFGE